MDLTNNIFSYATSELSQDAFICYLLSFAMKDNNSDDNLYKCSLEFINKMLPEESQLCYGDKIEKNAIKIKNVYRSYLNEYSELLINNNGIKNERMRALEETAEYLNNQRAIDAKNAAKRAMLTSAAAYAVGSYAGKKIGDAIVKTREDFTTHTVAKDGKEEKISYLDDYVHSQCEDLKGL